jgi:LmbE family N-acetylglucosaminyl deacetylase
MMHDVDDGRLLRWLRGEGDAPRTLIAFAHPDDETIGASAVLARLPRVRLLCATDGAPLDRRWWGDPSCASRADYASLRRRELEAALAVPNVPPSDMVQLPHGDQQLSLRLAELSHEVRAALEAGGAEVVLTHPYEGGHPDHDSVAFAVHAAVALLRRAGTRAPEIAEFASYHADGDGLATGSFLPRSEFTAWTVELSPGEREMKRRMLGAYASQRETLSQFGVETERFRPAPRYDFTAPPHPGPPWYERFDWGCTGAEWRQRAAEAMRALGLEAELGPGK